MPRFHHILILCLLLVVIVPPTSAWYSTYGYRQLHNVTGSSYWSGDQTNYQLMYTIFNTSGTSSGSTIYTSGHSLANWSDIRFTSTSDSVYDYWIETTNATSATVWVEVPTISKSATTETQLYFYYDKAGDTTGVNGANTFIMFDDFDTLDTERWDTSATPPTVSSSQLTLSGVSNGVCSHSHFAVNTSFMTSADLGEGNYIYLEYSTNADGTLGPFIQYQYGWPTASQFSARNYISSSSTVNLGLIPGTSIWEIKRNGTSSATYNINRTQVADITTQVLTGDDAHILLSNANAGDGPTSVFNWIAVKKYVYPQPVDSTWVSPETQAGGDTTPPESISNLANTTTCNSINWTWTNPGGDQNETVIWKDNMLLHNVTNTTTYDIWTSLSASTSYNFSSKTKDVAGNLNATFQNQSATTGAPAPVSTFTIQKPLYRIPGTLQANDTTTNTPTLWNWSWGDGLWTNGTTRNATHKYTKRGQFSITLLTSNACGSNTTPTATKARIVGYEDYQ